ncbi:MAG: hypothetical protein FD189_103 [Elusimicrobia bacterium]|nr:MAG: hypothetical protein FD154_255 [Elusimicrobiota bacterium]KAF0158461.1 MAG: hypothetical protein FD189_103 [Elusimicrobiota bacterium]
MTRKTRMKMLVSEHEPDMMEQLKLCLDNEECGVLAAFKQKEPGLRRLTGEGEGHE